LFGGSFPGMNDTLCGTCIGHQYVKAAKAAYLERGGEPCGIAQYYREHIDGEQNEFVGRVTHAGWLRRDHAM
jgi:hypothetical protein